MADAEVGDDVYGEDPTVNRLQEIAAGLFDKEAALFFPTGSMANQTAVKLHTTPGTEASAYNIADLDDIAPWALKSVCFCYEKKLLTGRGTSFAPLANATRAEACVVLCGLHDFLTASGG